MNALDTPASTDVLTISEAMAALKISRQLIYSEINSGRLKSLRIGRRRLISPQAISQYIADRERETQAQEQQEVARA